MILSQFNQIILIIGFLVLTLIYLLYVGYLERKKDKQFIDTLKEIQKDFERRNRKE